MYKRQPYLDFEMKNIDPINASKLTQTTVITKINQLIQKILFEKKKLIFTHVNHYKMC